ncbi:MAG: transcription elongation factor GreA [Lachnospiraceae bacterium]|nr:transcription elongation factor GreA [Lachnospiraceae bacterium]
MRERLTESDVKKIKSEIEDRKLNIRHQLLDEVKEARAHGDLSENFEYHAAKRAKNQNESRIRYLENMLKNAEVVSDDFTDGLVGMNNTVTIRFTQNDMKATYKIVTSIRSNSLKGKISIESPLGKALMGKAVGDTVHVVVDSSTEYDVVIESIDQSSDDADDEIKRF